ncbi:hypothetical protein ABE142_09825 [Paenibacillus alvei]|uniref:hypothetical protein n=1 Tax=Paenibacillus alvei TaxID=44250 RepID=UPI003D2C56C9
MKNQKVLSCLIVITVLTSAFSPTLIFAAPSSQKESQLEKVQSRIFQVTANGGLQISQQLIDDANILHEYVTKGEDGLLHIDPRAREKVHPESYALVENGVKILNESLISKATIIQGNHVVVNPNATDNNFSFSARSAFSNTYWWGVAITMNEQDTKLFAHSLKQVKEGFTAESIVAGIIAAIVSGPAAWAASAAGAIVAAGAGLVANSLEAYNNSNGVTLNIHWLPLPYYEVTVNSNKPY